MKEKRPTMTVKALEKLMGGKFPEPQSPGYHIDPTLLDNLIIKAARIDSIMVEANRILLSLLTVEEIIHSTIGKSVNWKEECEPDFQTDLQIAKDAVSLVCGWGQGDIFEVLNELAQPLRERERAERKARKGGRKHVDED